MRVQYIILIIFGIIFALMIGSFLLGISIGILPEENLVREIKRFYEYRLASFLAGLSLYIIGYIVTKTLIKRLTKEEIFISEGEFGRVAVSVNAVEDIVRKVLRTFDFIKKFKLNLHVQSKKLTITIRIKEWEGDEVSENVGSINTELKNRLDKVVGLKDNFETEIKIEKIEDPGWS